MKCTIENLWNGNFTPAENCGVGDAEIEELIALMERNRETLSKMLNAHQKLTFEKYIDCAEEYANLISMHAFSDGFCLASKLVTEAIL